MRSLFLLTDRFRKRRMRAFIAEFDPRDDTRVLDVGGTETNWAFTDIGSSVVLLNLTVPDNAAPDARDQSRRPSISWEEGDGCAMGYEEAAFDICFSNSTIEHLHTLERQQRFAAEVRRVARSYFVQTPARSFPFEPHWLGFFIHWLPRRWQPWYARYCTLYGLAVRPDPEDVRALIDEYRLLSHREMTQLFPDGEIRRERFLFMTKAYVAVRHEI